MLDHEDLKWIATTSTELNSILQQVSRYADLAQRQRGAHNYIELLGERVELATRTGQALFDRVTSKILVGATRKSASGRKRTARFTVVPPPVHTNTSPLSVPTSRQSAQKSVAPIAALLANGKENKPEPDTSEIL